MNKRTLATFFVSLIMLISVVTGATLALFTSEVRNSIAINTGRTEVIATIENFKLFSTQINTEGNTDQVERTNGTFINGGKASLNNGIISLSNMSNGDLVDFDIRVKNNSNVKIKYQIVIKTFNDAGLFSYLNITVDSVVFDGHEAKTEWLLLDENATIESSNEILSVVIGIPYEESAANDKSTEISVVVHAIPQNTILSDEFIYSRVDKDNYVDEVGEYFLFGNYPQRLENDEVIESQLYQASGAKKPTVSELNGWASYHYYLGGENDSNYMWYKDVELNNVKYRGVYMIYNRPNDINDSSSDSSATSQYNNGFLTEKLYWFEYQPIKWKIISETEEYFTLIADTVIDCQNFDISSNNYADSYIRNWLNNDFYNLAFSAKQKKLIQEASVKNEEDTTSVVPNLNASYNTHDNVYLFSYQDVTNEDNNFNPNSTLLDTLRVKTASSYALAQGCNITDGKANWLLRSPKAEKDLVNIITNEGIVSETSITKTNDSGICPAIRIKLD